MALFTSISICAYACSTDPSAALAYADLAASKAAVTADESISSILTASGDEISYYFCVTYILLYTDVVLYTCDLSLLFF